MIPICNTCIHHLNCAGTKRCVAYVELPAYIKTEITWREVFCTTHLKWWGCMDLALEGARQAGYSYIAWNGRVYHVALIQDTGITTDNLNGVDEREF